MKRCTEGRTRTGTSLLTADFESEETIQDVTKPLLLPGEQCNQMRSVGCDPRPFPTHLRPGDASRRGLGSRERSTLYFPRLA